MKIVETAYLLGAHSWEHEMLEEAGGEFMALYVRFTHIALCVILLTFLIPSSTATCGNCCWKRLVNSVQKSGQTQRWWRLPKTVAQCGWSLEKSYKQMSLLGQMAVKVYAANFSTPNVP
jgi:hypothetical protein